MSQSSNPNMQRDNVSETLKQFQKKGLQVSVVGHNSSPFPKTSTATPEIRPKLTPMTVDKISKVPIRPLISSESKPPTTAVRTPCSSEQNRPITARVTPVSSFHETKTSTTPARVSQPMADAKVFTPNWVNSNTVAESKPQANRPIATSTPVNKTASGQVRVVATENKTPVSRNNQVIFPETKVQGRVCQGQRHVLLSNEGKVQSNQERINVISTSSPDSITYNTPVRTNPSCGTRLLAPKSLDNKLNLIESKNASTPRAVPNMRLSSDSNTRPQYVNKVGKSPVAIQMAGENKQGNSVRMIAAVPDSSSVRVTPGKMPAVQMRVQQVPSFSEFSQSPQAKLVQAGSVLPAGTKVMLPVADLSSESPRSIPGKRGTSAGSPAKKKCTKRANPRNSKISAIISEEPASPEDGNENEEQFFNTLKSNSGLTITPVRTASSASTAPNFNSKMIEENVDKEDYGIVCSSCNNITSNPKFCHVCKCHLNTSVQNAQQTTEVVQNVPGASYVVTKTNVIKHIIFNPHDGTGQSQSFQFGQTVKKKYVIKSNPAIQANTRTRCPRRRRIVEPVCLTLSSDDEEENMQASFDSLSEENVNQPQMYPQESEGSKSGQSSPVYHEEDNESDDQFPGVTDINEKLPSEVYDEEGEGEYEDQMDVDENESMGEEEEGEEEDVEEEEEEEEIPPEDDDEEEEMSNKESAGMDDSLRCRSVRIGSLKVHPRSNNSFLRVLLSPDGLSFTAPMVNNQSKLVNITVKPSDVTQMSFHFGRCLPIVFIFTTASFAENVRKLLHMSPGHCEYYDPNSNDEKQKRITFLVDSINEEQKKFLRSVFLNDKKVIELDQKTANEILVRSTPNNVNILAQLPADRQLTVTAVQPAVCVKLVQTPVPVKKLFTYPPPPQLGGIAITTEDLACLEEGEFLNDTIIDFYLKYVFCEKLSEYHRDKTHVFSSYFFHRLTIKPERSRPGDEVLKTLQARRHSQVKTWTRHVDIFSKDFIIIPVNQNVHWFLAIICYPGLVPEISESSPTKSDSKSNNKSSDNVTSTDDQEDAKVKDSNSNADGSNPNSDENSTTSSNSIFDNEEPPPEAPDSSTHPDKNRRRKEAPCICIFDSLNGPNRSRIATMLREYLEIEWKMKKGTRKVFDKNTMQGFILQVPQQTNYSDCGIYLLQYVESFFENPIPYYDTPIPNLANWFPKEKVAKKRQELKDLILSLQKKYENSRKVPVTENVPPPTPTDNR